MVPIQALATFTADGSTIETDAAGAVPTRPTAAVVITSTTPGHGIWQPGPAIGTLFIQFISFVVNPNGTVHGKRTVTITGSLDSTGDQFKGSYQSQVVDTTGRVIATGSGNVTGQRIPHPLLP
jgi:hypothetical protein